MIFTKGSRRSVLKVALMRSLAGTKDQNTLAGRQEWLGGSWGAGAGSLEKEVTGLFLTSVSFMMVRFK